MRAQFFVSCLSLVLLVSARHLPMEWRPTSNLMHHYLYYDALDDLRDYEDGWHGLSQIIRYCIRPEPLRDLPLGPSIIDGTIHPLEEILRPNRTLRESPFKIPRQLGIPHSVLVLTGLSHRHSS